MDPHAGTSQPDPLIGQTIGNYLVTQKLGEGGMGSVYLAEHPGIGKKVALKVLHAEFSSNKDVAERFFNEAKAVNNIGHPNIVDIIDYGVLQSGLPSMGGGQLVYFIMEYLTGRTLSDLIRAESVLPPERALTIAIQVADALAASHRCGIVHRDLKPDNIMLQPRGREADFVKLLDFGIAKLTSDSKGSSRTRTGIVMGTPAYMSPEQCEGRNQVDHRTDVYALGIVLYEMLVGRVPFQGEGYGEVLVQHLTQPPLPPSQFRMMSAHVEMVVMKALEKRADLRYPTMDEFMRAISDPVGYVEAHGGIGGFIQRQLVPSSAPMPPMRMTPMPTSPMHTPPPGYLSSPSFVGPHMPTPSPTTLGAAAAQVAPARGKTGVIVASVAVVAAAAVAIAFVVTRDQGGGKGDDGDRGVALVKPEDKPPEDKPDDKPPEVKPDDKPPEVKPPEVKPEVKPPEVKPEDTAPPPEPTNATITLTTTPAGARIFVNGIEIDQVTPEPFTLPRSKKPVKIVLKLDKHDDHVIDAFVVDKDVSNDYTLKPKRRAGGGRGSATGRPGGSGPSDTGLIRPDD